MPSSGPSKTADSDSAVALIFAPNGRPRLLAVGRDIPVEVRQYLRNGLECGDSAKRGGEPAEQ